MSFGQVVDMGKRDIYRMKIQISEDITYKWITITPYGGWDTWGVRDGNAIKGYPFRDVYTFGIKTTVFHNWYIDINHYCSHDVITSRSPIANEPVQNYRWKGNIWDSQLTLITVGYKKSFSSFDLN
jgi:hypothetical protein